MNKIKIKKNSRIEEKLIKSKNVFLIYLDLESYPLSKESEKLKTYIFKKSQWKIFLDLVV